jgi:hypothetical protein
MKQNSFWIKASIFFFAGAFACYLTLQIQLFDLKLELDVPNLLLSIITLLVGLYIADTLQKRVSRVQNNYSYIVGKIDAIWMKFNKLSEKTTYSTRLDISDIKSINTEIIHPLSFLQQAFVSFGFDEKCICELVEKLDELENYLGNLPAENNVVSIEDVKEEISVKILGLNLCFSNILGVIQKG